MTIKQNAMNKKFPYGYDVNSYIDKEKPILIKDKKQKKESR